MPFQPTPALLDPFDFEWQVDTAGYRIKNLEHLKRAYGDAEDDPARSGADLLTQPVPELVGKGGRPRRYRPRVDAPAMYREFAAAPATPDRALAFTAKYGLLYEGKSVTLGEFFRFQSGLRRLLESTEEGRRMDRGIGARRYGERSEAATVFNRQTRVRFQLRLDDFTLGLKVTPVSLAGAILLAVAEDLAHGPQFVLCAHCGTSMFLGKGTEGQRGKRRDSRYCSDSCRALAAQKRKRETDEVRTRRPATTKQIGKATRKKPAARQD